MSVLLELNIGDIVIDLHSDLAPKACLNFLKLCKSKYYNFSPIYNVQKDFSFQTGDPIGPFSSSSDGGTSIWGLLPSAPPSKRLFRPEFHPKLKHEARGAVSMATAPLRHGADEEERVAGSQFIITLGDGLEFLDGKAAVFGQVVEGFDTLEKINAAFCDSGGRPLRDVRIKHTIVLDDPFPDPEGLGEMVPPGSPVPSKAQLETVRIGEGELEEEEEGGGIVEEDQEVAEKRRREREARAQALTLEMVGDLPFAEVRPPENVLFVCKLNPVTLGKSPPPRAVCGGNADGNLVWIDEDLELIFSRFGTILSCEVIRDKRTGDSLQYAFIEFENQKDCEQAYFKMQGVLIDDHRIHVDFSQSVSKLSDAWRNATNAKRQTSRGFGGSSKLEKRQQYRDSHRGRDTSAERYRMVFEEREKVRREKEKEDRGGNGSGRGEHDAEYNGGRRRSMSRSRSPPRRGGGYERDRGAHGSRGRGGGGGEWRGGGGWSRERNRDCEREQDRDRRGERERERERERDRRGGRDYDRHRRR